MKTSEFIKVAEQLSGFRPMHAPHGAGMGAAAGGLVGGAAGLASGLLMDDEEQPPWYKRLLIGAGIGAVVGGTGGGVASSKARFNKLDSIMNDEFTDNMAKLPEGLREPMINLAAEKYDEQNTQRAVPWKRVPEMLRPGKNFDKEIDQYNLPNTERIQREAAGDTMGILINHMLQEAATKKQPNKA